MTGELCEPSREHLECLDRLFLYSFGLVTANCFVQPRDLISCPLSLLSSSAQLTQLSIFVQQFILVLSGMAAAGTRGF